MPVGKNTRRLRWALVLTGVVGVALVAFTGWQALQAKDALELVADDFVALEDQIAEGEEQEARVTLVRAQEHAADAHAHTHGPGWWLTSQLPAVGDNVDAVRTVTDVVDALAADVLPTVVDASARLRPDNLRPQDGRVDLAPIGRVAPALVEADRLFQAEAARVLELETDGLAPQIEAPIELLQEKLAQATSLSDRASRAVRLLPPMLGADGPRSYLLLFQNNAELRATGGIPGSFAVVHARDGRISIGRQGDASTIGRFEEPPIPLTADEVRLFGKNLGRYAQDVNFTPDFPRSAELIRAMWNARHGLQVDGVASTDPVALSYLLRGTGPIEVAGGRELTAENAVRLLLADVYAEIPDPTLQNVFFASVAKQVFDVVASGQGEPRAVLEGLSQAAGEQRILMWSSVEQEQALLAPTALGGVLHQEPTPSPRVGIFLNDGTGAKMDYYLHYEADVKPVRCQGERQVLDVTLRVRSTAPEGGAGLPDYVAESVAGLPRGTIRTNVLAYAPIGGYVDHAEIDGETTGMAEARHGERDLVQTTIDVLPGQRRVLRFTMLSGAGQHEAVVLRVTPGVNGPGVGSVGQPAC